MKYGAILKACRMRAGLKQDELAFELHVTQSDISKIETDAKEPGISLFNAWIQSTQTQEVMVAFICGVDGLSIMQNLTDVISSTVIWFL